MRARPEVLDRLDDLVVIDSTGQGTAVRDPSRILDQFAQHPVANRKGLADVRGQQINPTVQLLGTVKGLSRLDSCLLACREDLVFSLTAGRVGLFDECPGPGKDLLAVGVGSVLQAGGCDRGDLGMTPDLDRLPHQCPVSGREL